ncbi:MAG: porin [Gammaproteobacteria bacterium]|nr:porin [Gammaproteobacteria bacterium]
MNNKILLAAAVAVACGAPVAAMADANIYGQFRYSLNSMDADKGAGAALSGQDNVSLFGLKAESEGDGIKAFIHLQTGANADGDGASSTTTTYTDSAGDTVDVTNTTDGGRAFAQRFYFGGLKGGFGTVAYGRMSTSYKMVGFKMDPFYNLTHVGANGQLSKSLATYGLSAANNGFTDNALQYTSNAMAGVTVNVGLYVDDGDQDNHGTAAGVAYSKDGITAGVQFIASDASPTVAKLGVDNDAMRIHGGYKADSWSVDASFETVSSNAGADDKSYMFLVGKYNVSKETQIAMTIGTVGDDNNGADEGTGFTLGAFQTVAPKTQVYASYSTASLDNITTADSGADPSVFSLGAIHKF